MSQVAFDTLEYAQSLRDAGMPQKEAEAFARANASAFRQMLGQQELATKTDLEKLRIELNANLEKSQAQLEARLTKHMFNMLLAFAGAIGAFFAIAAFFLRA